MNILLLMAGDSADYGDGVGPGGADLCQPVFDLA